MQNLREKETNLLGKMLSVSSSGTIGGGDFEDQWKVLVYDQDGRDIISPLLNVGALRQKGVTLHLLLHSDREQISDAPAIYFLRPTEANLKRVVEDCSKQLYRNITLHFITKIERLMLEKFAQDLVTANAVSSIAKIFDQYLDVIALEPTLFTLNIKDAFSMYNEPSLSELQIRAFMSRVAMGLLSSVRVMGALPIIRAPPGGAAEMLAHEVNNVLKENISSRGPAQALFEDSLMHDRSRPLLLIIDRSADLFPILQHNSAYQALISDLLEFKLNRVTIESADKANAGSNSTSTKKKTYDLNSHTDLFLKQYASAPFPEAVDANEKELNEVSQREASIRSRPDFNANKAMDGTQNMDNMLQNMEGKGKDLSEALESLPEILQKKAHLEAHTNVMQAVMKSIVAREIPTFFELEQSILTSGGRSIDRAAILSLLKDGTKGLLHDKARLLMILAASGDPTSLSKSGSEEYDAAFQVGCAALSNPPTPEAIAKALAAVSFVRRLLSLQAGPMSKFGSGAGFGGGSSNAIFSSILNTAQSKATSLIAKAASFFTKFTPYYVTRIVYNLAEGRGAEDETFVTLDPRGREQDYGKGHKYSDIIVFVLGGGCYSEYFNLLESLNEKSSSGGSLRSILYGCTDLLSGDEFVNELQRLSNNGSSSPVPSK